VRVTGRVVFGADAVPFSGATAIVSVEDTTYADARAIKLASWTTDDVSYPRDATGVEFEVDVQPDPPDNVRCTLRALIDVDRDGSAGQGDYVNVESVPAGRGTGAIDVRVKRIGAAA
jgi:hypothetical protein